MRRKKRRTPAIVSEGAGGREARRFGGRFHFDRIDCADKVLAMNSSCRLLRSAFKALGMVIAQGLTATEVLPDEFPVLSTEARVEEAAVAPDGSVFIEGVFTSVDGVARPGLAKLRADGTLDPEFAPLDAPDLSIIDEFGSQVLWGWGGEEDELFALSNGGLMRSNSMRFEVRRADGTVDENALLDLREEGASVRPQFEKDGRLWLVILRRGIDPIRRIVVRDSETLAPIGELELADNLPEPPTNISPAAGGGLWVMGRADGPIVFTSTVPFVPRHVLYRLSADGALDESFGVEELPSQQWYRLEHSSGAEVVLSSISGIRFRYWPAPENQVRNFQFRDAGGTGVSNDSFISSFGISSEYVIRAGEVLGFQPYRSDRVSSGGRSGELAATQIELDENFLPSRLTALDVFPDGQLLLGGIRRITDEGLLAPDWHVVRLEGRTDVRQLLPLRNGDVLARGDFDLASGSKRLGAVRLGSDGALKTSFRSELDLRRALNLVEKRNGNFLALMGRDYVDGEGEKSRLLELDSDGAILRAIPLDFAGSRWSPEEGRSFSDDTSIWFALQPDDSIILRVTSGWEVRSTWSWRMPQGDPGRAERILNSLGLNVGVIPLPDGRLLVGREIYTAEGLRSPGGEILPTGASYVSSLEDGTLVLSESSMAEGTRHFLWTPEEGRIAGFESRDVSKLGFWSPVFRQAARGKTLVTSDDSFSRVGFTPGIFDLQFFANALWRLHANGQVDPTFKATPDPFSLFHSTLAMGSDSPAPTIWVAGNFTEVNGEARKGLAILSDAQASGFQEWMRACAGVAPGVPTMFSEGGDADGDGYSNFFEYAAGSHPIEKSVIGQGIEKADRLTWQVTCNPEAPEVVRRVEVSDDLRTWRPAQAAEVRIETGLRCFNWKLQEGRSGVYSRLKVSR